MINWPYQHSNGVQDVEEGVPGPLDEVRDIVQQAKEVVRVADHLSDWPRIRYQQQANATGHLNE